MKECFHGFDRILGRIFEVLEVVQTPITVVLFGVECQHRGRRVQSRTIIAAV